MTSRNEAFHYLYPLNPKSEQGYVLNKRGKEVPASRKGFFDTVDYSKLDKWGVSKNANQLKIGDRIWVHFAKLYSSLGAVGTVAREARWQRDWNRPALWLFASLSLLLTSCGYRIAIESANTTTTTTTTMTTSPQRSTTTTAERADYCTSLNLAELQEMRREVRLASETASEDPTPSSWRAYGDVLVKYRDYIRSLHLPKLTTKQDALSDAIPGFVSALDRYWESGRQNLSYIDYNDAYNLANEIFFSGFLLECT